jgi:DNA-binding response OmpR family regulator
MAAILVVDDDRKTVDLIKLYLEHAGFEVCTAYDGERALELVVERAPDLLVLDLMLPKLDGLDVCRALQAISPVPVIMLTARTTEGDKLAGLDSGADDYVTKPFSPRELVARVKAVLRRARTAADDPVEIRTRASWWSRSTTRSPARGEPVRLTPREFSLLRVLSGAPGRPFTRLGLLERAFGYDYDGLERTVDVHIANLRRKLEADPTHPRYLATVQGIGYKFVVEEAP